MLFKLHGHHKDGSPDYLTWEQSTCDLRFSNGADVIVASEKEKRTYHIDNQPGTIKKGKSTDPKRVRIVLGMGCNFTCLYCRQRNVGNETNSADIGKILKFVSDLRIKCKGGTDGLGKGMWIELRGGEPFVYWKMIKPLMVELKHAFPNAEYSTITNGSLLDEEKVDWLIENRIWTTISHDGPGQPLRGEDPLTNPETLSQIRRLFNADETGYRVAFNCVLTRDNYSISEIKKYINDRLDIGRPTRVLVENIAAAVNNDTKLISAIDDSHRITMQNQLFNDFVNDGLMAVAGGGILRNFMNDLANKRPIETFSQQCEVEKQDTLAIDLNGNVYACHNSVNSSKVSGSINDLDNVQLTGVTHFLMKETCRKCIIAPVCQACPLDIESDYNTVSCQNAYTFYFPFFAAAIYVITGFTISRIENVE